MTRYQVRGEPINGHPGPRFCDIVVDGNEKYFVLKRGKEYISITAEDLLNQLESAVKDSEQKKELPQPAS